MWTCGHILDAEKKGRSVNAGRGITCGSRLVRTTAAFLHGASARPQRRAGLAFGSQRAQHCCMTPGIVKHEPTAGALRAARQLQPNPHLVESTAELIDRETGLRELMDILEAVLAEAGDLIESRSPELLAAARAALRHYADGLLRQAE
jgi:hypothetical protein